MNGITAFIQESMLAAGNEEKARWLERYVKHGIQSRGVGIPVIRSIVREANRTFSLSTQPVEVQAGVLNELMCQPYTEDKLAAILYMQLFWKQLSMEKQLDLISAWYDQQWVSDWNVCDWLCVRILTPFVDLAPEKAIPVFMRWNESSDLWKARASLVPFAQSKTLALHKLTILPLAARLIQREERFCKTAVGWVMRELSSTDAQYVENFLRQYQKWLIPEVRKNATKYLY